MMERAFEGFAALPPGRSHWDVLGVPAGSGRDAILSAYRAKAMTAHPDGGGSSDEFTRLTDARDAALREAP